MCGGGDGGGKGQWGNGSALVMFFRPSYLLHTPSTPRPHPINTPSTQPSTPPQVVVPLEKKKPDAESVSLVEVGPRFTLNPVKIFDGSFGGATIYDNPQYTSPNAVGARGSDPRP